ncbi:MAG: hypothetical protein PVI87_03800 [Gammaproteobacteria bacterium]|jgi:hypothetical protein
MSTTYLAIGIAVLVALLFMVFLLGRGEEQKKLTPMAGLAFAFVIAGIAFGEARLLGYMLFTIGVILAMADIAQKSRSH